jgi:6-pyruvoyltetrahydropterin/6-carboxytetrahydropterin synthase
MDTMHAKVVVAIAILVAASASEAVQTRPTSFSLGRNTNLQRRCFMIELAGLTAMRLRGGHHEGYSLGIRDSMMIAHSFQGEEFGPAQGLHGATYTVDVEFSTEKLTDKLNWVMDIGVAMDVLKKVLAPYNFKNLDEVFPGENTTTEFMCRKVFEGLSNELKGIFFGSVKVKLWESHSAWASFTGEIH